MRQITLTPPPGLFAAVQIETVDEEIVGAAGPCFTEVPTKTTPGGAVIEMQKIPKTRITAVVTTTDRHLRCRWVYEDSSQGVVMSDYQHGGSRWG